MDLLYLRDSRNAAECGCGRSVGRHDGFAGDLVFFPPASSRGFRMIRAQIFLCAAISLVCHAQDQRLKPDVYLITIDTLRADHVHCYGYERIRTPALDSLATEGIRFSEAFTPSPVTNTSHASIFTALLPSVHGVTDFGIPLPPLHPTWAELLHNQGYKTAAFIGAVILDSKALAPGFDRGFDFYDNFPANTSSKSRWGRLERRGMDVAERTEAWLGAHTAGPHFVWMHLYDPHDPYEPPAPYANAYKDRPYDGEIAYADSALGHFLAYLKARHRYDNALIVVVGDHGEGLGDHHEDTHGIFLYDSTTHVPLIVKLPAQENAGKVVQAQVRTTDILPTVLDVARAPIPPNLDGRSLEPYFGVGETDERKAFAETDYPLRFGWAPIRSLRTKDLLFIEAPRPELYDLHADPAELENRYEPWNHDVLTFRDLLAKLRARAPSAPSGAAVGPQTIAELRALGYLGLADAGSSTNVPEPSLMPDPKDKIELQNLLHAAMLDADEGRTSQARQALKKLLELDSKFYVGIRQLAELEFQADELRPAADHLAKARELQPGDASTAFLLGRVKERMNDLAGARDALEDSLKLMPGQFEARLLLGQVCMKLKESKAAEDQFAAALLIHPNDNRAVAWLARAKAGAR
jgi:arylsulfatase A-like enzyme